MANFSLKNKVAVITGAASGIGFAIAEEFLKKEAKTVILLDINENSGKNAAIELNSKYGAQKTYFIKCDVTSDIENVSESIFGKYDKVDILVNSAGIVNENSVRKTMEINAIALMEWSLKFYEHMENNKYGTIINISSTYGYQIDQFLPVYKASKFAVYGFSKTLGHSSNFKKSGVKVIVICPSSTKTNLIPCIKRSESWDDFTKTIIMQNPEAVGIAAAQLLENAESGTAWLVRRGVITEIPCSFQMQF